LPFKPEQNLKTVLLGLLLLLTSTLPSQAQDTSLTKEQTVTYIKRLYKANYDRLMSAISDMYLDGKVLIIETGDHTFRKDLTLDHPNALQIVEETNYLNEKLYRIRSKNLSYLYHIRTESDAQLLKKALVHLMTLVQKENRNKRKKAYSN